MLIVVGCKKKKNTFDTGVLYENVKRLLYAAYYMVMCVSLQITLAITADV